jgi:translation initiation factor IF-3
MNQQIRATQVRLIDHDGEMVGVVNTREAITMAEEVGLDLIEVSPNADPPVCKILDYGKYKYEQQKKKNEARKKQKVMEIKELRLRPVIGDHDLEIKLNNAKRFLKEGDKVKFVLKFRGREMANQDQGRTIMNRVQEALAELSKIEQFPKMEGRSMIMVVTPITSADKP